MLAQVQESQKGHPSFLLLSAIPELKALSLKSLALKISTQEKLYPYICQAP